MLKDPAFWQSSSVPARQAAVRSPQRLLKEARLSKSSGKPEGWTRQATCSGC